MLDVQALRKIQPITVAALRQYPALEDMRVLQKGNRLSITPVDARHWDFIMGLVKAQD